MRMLDANFKRMVRELPAETVMGLGMPYIDMYTLDHSGITDDITKRKVFWLLQQEWTLDMYARQSNSNIQY